MFPPIEPTMSVGSFMMCGLRYRDVFWARFDDSDARANMSGAMQT